MSSLGVYFGLQVINIVETKGRQLSNNIRIPYSTFLNAEPLDAKVPEEDKIGILIKDALKKNKIEINEAAISLTGKDFIIRNFEMPIMPRQELNNAVNFEVKKYIPFKLEDMVSDFQFKLDRANHKNYALFAGIKKEVFNKYISIFKQTGIKIKSIEYSGFSLLRLLSLANIRDREAIAVVDIDLTEEDEVNFMVLEGGFPLFSRDITFVGEFRQGLSAKDAQFNAALEKLKNEIRVSLSYYDRTFPLKSINKIFFLMDTDYRGDLESFVKDIGLSAQFINVSKFIGKALPFSLVFLKGYSTSIADIKIVPQIDLLLAKEKSKKITKQGPLSVISLLKQSKPHLPIIAICLLMCVAVYILGVYRILPLQREIKNIMDMRPVVTNAPKEAGYEELVSFNNAYVTKIKTIDDLIKKQLYLTEVFDAIPRALSKDMRLTDLSFKKEEDRNELVLSGIVYSGNSDKELELVNLFLSRLKESPVFQKYFTDNKIGNISITSVEHSQHKEKIVTNFTIGCRDYKEGEWNK